ncbi:MAG: alpha/beta hydrolase [Deltaproteobacteria bacterium]|nr:alpha/beta hydrolase [Deltaproteobacteria bacterium]
MDAELLREIRKQIFPAKPDDFAIPKIGNDELIELANGNRIVRGLLAKSGPSLMVLFHGNGSTINKEVVPARFFYSHHLSVLLVEYPGYGVSAEYEASESNLYSDSERLVKFVQQTYGFDNKSTFLYGRSLGSGVAVEMARKGMGSKLVLITPFTSMPAVATALDPANEAFIPFMLDKFDNISKSKEIELPVLMIHGDKDKTVPHEMAAALAKSFPDAELITLDSDKHGDIYQDIDEALWKRVENFIKDP